MNSDKSRLIELVRDRSFQMSDTPSFKLSSGGTSRFYFNMKPVTHSPEGLHLIGGLYLDRLDELGIRPAAIGGLTMGADPIADAVALASYHRPPGIEAFVIRKEPKQHGMTLQLEGQVREGDSVVIVDDVVTTGGATLKAIDVAEAQNVQIKAVVVLLDREEKNGMQNIASRGYPAHAILRLRDFL